MQFALLTPYRKFCKGDLMMVNWPKFFVKVKIKRKAYIVVFERNLKQFVFF
jgi:hypothetical protein